MSDGVQTAELQRRLRADVESLCSDRCAGRAAGSVGGRAARAIVWDALLGAGLEPLEQPLANGQGANVIAHVPGTAPGWILVAAHYDHLGTRGHGVYRGADDNAAAVAMLLELARALVGQPPSGRGVVLAAFDSEEPPSFLHGSRQYVSAPSVPLAELDLMVCMDLVGHVLGSPAAPRAVRDSLFVLGAEHGQGIAALVDAISEAEPGVIARRANADIVPPLSDYGPFWQRKVPFVFLTCGRSRQYHTVDDTPDRLQDEVLAARARWLERLTRAACAHSQRPIRFVHDAADDAATLRSLSAIVAPIARSSTEAQQLAAAIRTLLTQCDGEGRLPPSLRAELQPLVSALESALA